MRRNDESPRRPGTSPRTPRIDLLLPLVSRDALPWRTDASAGADQRPAAAIGASARAAAGQPGAFVLAGGEPLGRADIWELLEAIAEVRPDQLGLWTAGHRLAASVVPRLRAAGVQRVHIPFHCARQDAHDWLVGQPGALKVAHRAIRACLDGELPVVAEIVLTRPTAPHVAETIEVLARLGVRAVSVRRLTQADAPGPQFVTLSPRLALLEQSLERAAAVALERRVRLALRDLPLCVAPRLRPLLATPESERWVAADGHSAPRSETAPGCPSCPAAPYCAGAPLDYTQRFGWEEFANRADTAARVAESVGAQRDGALSAPMVFAWDGPSRLACATCADPPAGDGARPESTRVVRARLVAAARHRPAVLRLVGADILAHPEAAKLIGDAVRLFARVEVAGEASAVADWSDLDLRRLREVQRFDVALYGPDADTHDAHCGLAGGFAATIRAAQRLRAKANLRVGGYAILHDARPVPAYAAAWEEGQLPGEPRFRLAASGGSLDDLIEAARALPVGRARRALLAVLPRCLTTDAGLADDEVPAAAPAGLGQQRIHFGRSMPYDPCGADPLGAFAPCPTGSGGCAIAGCPGRAIGWHSTARSQRWGSSI